MKRFSRPIRTARSHNKKKKKIGVPPGTLIYTGEKPKIPTKIRITDYNDENYSIIEEFPLEKNLQVIEKNNIRWVEITGLTEVDRIEEIGNQFKIHPLVLEDILNPNQRPKFEDYGNYIFIVLNKLLWDESKEIFESEQISLILGENFVISFSELESDTFKPIIERIITARGRIRFMKADYLAYALIDVIIDNYFLILEIFGELIDELEDKVIKNPEPEIMQSIYRLKRFSIDLRKSIWPLRQVINKLQREKSNLISDDLQIYLKDISDHIYRISDQLENDRDIIFGMLDMYLSSVSNKMNDIMKVLTMISTIFIPLSFIAGFYGMNFIVYPNFRYDLLMIFIIIMIVIALLMLLLFKKKKWI
ncbi:MAG: magnesium/cobalt transporter CorA [Promethearchaeota archaeon]